MSSPKFMVFKLRDLKIPLLILFIAALIFVFLTFRNKSAAQTFAPFNSYQDGRYIAGIALGEADMDLVVEIKDNSITSVSLSGLTESSTPLYADLLSSLDYVNTYVTSTQSIELPETAHITATTQMLMDALQVALSSDENAQLSSIYQKSDLSSADLTAGNNTDDEIFVDEFEDDALSNSDTSTDKNSESVVSSEEEASEPLVNDIEISSDGDTATQDTLQNSGN